MNTSKTEKLKIIYRNVSELIPYARNARTHSEEQIARIVCSIEEFGFTNPILLNGENGILAGHGRLMAAKKLGMTQVPTIDLVGMSEAQARAYILADNKLALDAGWDEDLLVSELEALKDLDFDLELAGFSDEEVEKLFDEWNGERTRDVPRPAPDEMLVSENVSYARGQEFRFCIHRLIKKRHTHDLERM